MPRRKFIDKKNATTFQLVHRAQNDPLIHDSDVSDMVFKEVGAPNVRQAQGVGQTYPGGPHKISSRGDLEEEFGLSVRENEGEAANYGIYYDDSEYDYMQHMRDLGAASGEATWVEAPRQKGKGKEKKSLEDALRDASLDDSLSEGGVSLASSTASHSARDVFDDRMLPSEFVQPRTYQDQQNIPDEIAGFQPDMDPRLREVLEALEDEAYVDDDEDVFAELAHDGVEVDKYDWEDQYWEDEPAEDDEGWETDDTIKADGKKAKQHSGPPAQSAGDLPTSDALPPDSEEGGQGDWMAEFSKYKKDMKAPKASKPSPQDLRSGSVATGTSFLTSGGRRKKRKGALTSSAGYSMTSSAIQRTSALTLLDERYEKIEEEYADDGMYDGDDGVSLVSGMTGVSGVSGLSKASGVSRASRAESEAPQLVRADFDSIMDEFLDGYSMSGKRRVKKGSDQSGLDQLDEIRKGLGPARVKTQTAS